MPPPEPLAPPTAELDTLGKEEGVDQADTSTCSELLNEDASRAVAPTQTQEDAAPSCDEVVSEVIEVAPVVKSSSKCALQYTSQKEEPGKARDMEAARGDIAEQDIYEHSIPIDAVDKVFDMVEKYDVALGVAALDMPSVCVPEMTKHRATPDEFVAISADDSTASAADHGAVDDSRLHVAFDAIERTLTASPRGGHAEIKGGDDLIDQVQPPVTGAKTSGPAEKEVEMDPTVKGDIRTKNDDSVTEEGLQDPEPTENIVGTMIGSPPTTVIQSPVPTVEAPADSSTRVEAVPNVTEGGEGVEEAKNGNLLEVCSGKLFNAQYAEAESLLKEMLQSSDYDTASVLSLAGIMCIATGEYEPAEPLFVSAIDLLSKEGSEQNSVTSARAWVHLGEAYRCLCKNVSATKCIRKAEEILGPLEDCCSRERIELEVEVVGLQMRNAFDFCHIKTSLMLCAKAFELTTKHLPHDSHLKASATLALGVKALEKGHWEGAMHLIKPAHDYRLAHFTADHPAIAESTLMLGRYYIGTGQYAQAIDAITGAIEAMQRKFRNHPLLARLLYAIAEAHRLQGNMTSSARRHQQAFDMRQHIYKTSAHTEVVQSMCGIGLIKMGCGNYREAVDWLEKSLELRKEVMDAMVIKEHLEYDMHRVWLTHAKMTCSMNFSLRDVDMKLMKDSYGPSHQDLIDALMTVAYCLMYKGKFTDADKVLDKVLAMSQMVYGEKHPMMAAILHAKAENKRLPGNFDEAAALSTDSLNMRVDTLGRDSLWVVMSLLQRAFLLLDMGDALGAGEVSANVIKMITVRIDKDNALYGRALGLMGECCRQMEQYDSAERYLSSSLRILENLLGNKHVHTVEVLVCHAMLLMDSENEDKLLNAKLSLEKCSEWTREILGDSHPLNAFIDANHGMCVNALTTFYTKERDMAKLEKMLDRKSAWLASVRQDADFTLESVARSAPLPGEDDISQAMRYLQTYPFGSFNPRHYWRERFGDVDKDSQACIVPQAANASETLRDESGQELTSKVEAEAVQSPFQAFLSSNPTVDELAAARRGSVKDRYEVVSGKLNLKGRRTKPVKPPKPHHLVDDALLTKQQSRRQSAFSNLLMQRSGSVRVVEGGMNDEKKESSDNTNAKESGLNGIEREASEVLEPSQQSAPPDDKDKEEGIKEPVAAPPACDKEQSTRNLEIMQTTDVVEVAQEKPPQCEHAETSFAKPMDADTGDGGLVRRLSKMFGERGGSKAGSRRGSADAGTPAGTPAGPPDAVRRMSGLIVAHHSGALADLADAGSDTTAAPPQPAPQPAPDDQAPDDPAPQSAPDEPADSQTTHSSEPDSGMRTVPTETSGVHKNSATSSRKTSRDFTSRPLQGQAEDKSAHGQAEDTSGEGKSGENARRSSLQRISTSFLNHIDLVSPRVSPRQE
jgi:tetratricopeptide (TPR) repeat protein